MERLNILVLHKMGDPRLWRNAVKGHEYLLPRCEPDHNYIVHPTELPLPSFIKRLRFHGIILGPTFLGHRYNPSYRRVRREYAFIRDSSAYKIALPQDDYNCPAFLDEWLVDWNIDEAYSVIDGFHDVLYPKYSKIKKLKKGYTSYISDEWIDSWRNPKPYKGREIDVSYRASKLPPNFGQIGYVKGIIGERFIRATKDYGLNVDISTDPKDLIPGSKWNSFIEGSKYCLVSNSGSSLIDARGEIASAVKCALRRKPNASFEEIERQCFPNEDGRYILTAISPRNIEAALAETAQIATPGTYGGIMNPDSEYIPINEDCSNIKEVLEKMSDIQFRNMIVGNCKEAFLSEPRLRARNHAKSLVQGILSSSRIGSDFDSFGSFRAIKDRHNRYVSRLSKAYWPARRVYRYMKSRVVG